jgi:hypothetical protein
MQQHFMLCRQLLHGGCSYSMRCLLLLWRVWVCSECSRLHSKKLQLKEI